MRVCRAKTSGTWTWRTPSRYKAQGRQFRCVVVPLAKSRLLNRTLVYTALTRGVEQVVFAGDRRTCEEAVVSPPSASLLQAGFYIWRLE